MARDETGGHGARGSGEGTEGTTTHACVHDDLDGYGCSTVIARVCRDPRVVHVGRYAEIAGVLEALLEGELREAERPARVVMADLGLEGPTLSVLSAFQAANERRVAGGLAPHAMVVLDHHGSSARAALAHHETRDGVRRAAFPLVEVGPGAWGLVDRGLRILVDTSRCATALCLAEAASYATRSPDEVAAAMADAGLARLVELVGAVDLWSTGAPCFPVAMAVADAFEEVRRSLVPAGYEGHDALVSGFLGLAARVAADRWPAAFERTASALKVEAVDLWLAGEAADDKGETTRVRTSRRIAREGGLYKPVATAMGPVLACFDVEFGVFQRTSAMMLATEGAAAPTYVDFHRDGTLSLRSRNGGAQRLARALGGGGHPDAAGASLPGGAVTRLEEALARFVPGVEAASGSRWDGWDRRSAEGRRGEG